MINIKMIGISTHMSPALYRYSMQVSNITFKKEVILMLYSIIEKVFKLKEKLIT